MTTIMIMNTEARPPAEPASAGAGAMAAWQVAGGWWLALVAGGWPVDLHAAVRRTSNRGQGDS